jgi:iron(III) transport system substrate-binding protein
MPRKIAPMGGTPMRSRIGFAAALLAAALADLGAGLPAQAQAPDRADADAARKEGSVSWYTSTPVALAQQLADAFQQQTGIEVELLRTGGQAVLRRLQQEISAGRPGADVMTMSDAGAANALAKQGLFEPFRPEGFDKVVEGARDRDGRWIAQRLSIIGIPVRTDKVKDVPTTWSDLKHPKYKGLMVMPDPSFTAIQLVVVGMLSHTLGWDFYKALRANETMIVQGHQQVFSTMQQGERVIGAEGADPRSFAKGQDVPNQKLIYPAEGVFIVSSPTALIKGARHPNAAKLFAQFMISPQAQRMIAAGGIHAARVDIAPPPGQPALSAVKFLPVDLDLIEEQGRELKAKFADIFQ